LAGHTKLDARASYPVGGVRLTVDIHNLLDAKFNSTGFPDPAGSSLIYYYPAAGRVFTVGLESGW
jgi:outer membrane receptor protein involved in Fe transport